jgi:hypothetical protein
MSTAWAILGTLVIGCGGATASGNAEPGESTEGRHQNTTDGKSWSSLSGGSSGSGALGTMGGSQLFRGSTGPGGGTRAFGNSASTMRTAQSAGGLPSSSSRAVGAAPMTSGGASTTIAFGGSPSNSAGSPSQAGAIDPCSLSGAHCTPTSPPWTECMQRGGACVVVSSSLGQCPAGSYNPFSANTYCPASFIGRCCVPDGDVGSPCDQSKACRTGACWPEAARYPLGGVCGQACSADNCPAYGTCITVPWSAAPSVCLVACTEDRFCRAGQSCQAFSRQFGGGEITYACWSSESPTGKVLGESCARDSECLSYYCRPDSTGASRCSAPCSASKPCLNGYACVNDPACSTGECDFCFAK